MSGVNHSKQLLIAGALFTLHNIEEAVGFAHFVYPHNLPFGLRSHNSTAMIVAIGMTTIIAWLLIMWANIQTKESNRKNLLTILVSVFIVNAVFPHIAGTIVLQRYFPAVITSVLLYLPYSFWLMPKLYRSYTSRHYFYILITGGLCLALVLVLVLHFFVNIYLHYL
jgi:hypothetical protein